MPYEEIVVTKTDPSKDQEYPSDIVLAVETRKCPPDLAVKVPGLSDSNYVCKSSFETMFPKLNQTTK